MPQCSVCFRHCMLNEGQTGFCGGRVCKDGQITAGNYGKITSIALDPIEKKPLHRFHPGSRILSVGSYGCNLRCPFCQNYSISWSKDALSLAQQTEILTPEELTGIALQYRSSGNIGIAFTYNEPLIGYEFVRDTAKLLHTAGMLCVLVTNGTAEPDVLEEIGPSIDAMNIDLKGFTDHYYSDILGGSLNMVRSFIARAVQLCHVELTTLIVPGENDSDEEIRMMTQWISDLKNANGQIIGSKVPLHISRFFPRFRMLDRNPTDVRTIYRLAEIAREKLNYVYTGNC